MNPEKPRKKMRYLLAFDSRGNEIEPLLQKNYAGEFHMMVNPGATIQELAQSVSEALDFGYGASYHHIIIQVGVNNFTTKVGGKVYCNYTHIAEAVADLKYQYSMLYTQILKKKRGIKITICPIVGISISRYNDDGMVHPEQAVINGAVMEINKWIAYQNSSSGLITPRLERLVHKVRGKGRKDQHRYSNLAKDGLHLSKTIKEDWVAELSVVMSAHGVLFQ